MSDRQSVFARVRNM